MSTFSEAELEKAFISLIKKQGYEYVHGENIHKEVTEVLLYDDLKSYLSARYAAQNITPGEIASIIQLLDGYSRADLYASNKAIIKMVAEGFSFKRENPREKDLFIELLDFSGKHNICKVINQLEIRGAEITRIPDAIIYINGLPLVVIEFKTAIKENATLEDAYKQLTVRYRRDIPELLKYNAFIIISDGANNKCGTLFTDYEFFYGWRITGSDPDEKDGISSLYTMVEGLLSKDTLLDVVRNFLFFPDTTKKEVKIVCRYPQYYAANKLLENIKKHLRPKGDGKGGTYFGATGCGKSFTMLFLTRLLMRNKGLASPTIVLITDRTDLDDQLSRQFTTAKQYVGDDCIESVETRDALKERLKGHKSGGVFLTTIQKFSEDISLLSDRENIICISDEAHRSQINLDQNLKITKEGIEKTYGFAKYLRDSFPNATYVGFTGTPIDSTIDVFGKVVDKYTMVESVKDGITVNVVYEGRSSRTLINHKKLEEIEKYYEACEAKGANEYQVAESKKTVASLKEVVGHPDRIKAVAKDFVTHYEGRIAENATVLGKAMFVCLDREIAYALYNEIISLRPDWAIKRLADADAELTDKEKQKLKPIEKIKMVMTRDKDDAPELYTMLGDREYRKELDRQFKNEKSNFKIAIVVDMWTTGFDVPCLDTMYIDKFIQRHTLIQTISRVNRVFKGKENGLVVDYIGIKSSMQKAIRQYGPEGGKIEETEAFVKIVKDQLDILNRLFHGFNDSDFYKEDSEKRLLCLNKAVEFIQKTEDLRDRFMRNAKKLKTAFNMCSSSEMISSRERDYIHFHMAIRAVLYKLTKGEAPDATQMNAKVREMIKEALISNDVEELFKIGKEKEVDIFSEEYLEKIQKIPYPNIKIQLLERLLRETLNAYKKVNKIKAADFSERLKKIVEEYNNRKEDARDIINSVTSKLVDLIQSLKEEQKSFEKLGIDFEEKAFYDILKAVRDKYKFEYPEEKILVLAKEIKKIVADKTRYTDWAVRDNIKAALQSELEILLDAHGYPPKANDDVYNEVLEQAENFKKYASA